MEPRVRESLSEHFLPERLGRRESMRTSSREISMPEDFLTPHSKA